MTYRKFCTVPGCGQKHVAIGYCRTHYSRWQRHGSIADPAVSKGDCQRWLQDHAGFDGDECLTWPFARVVSGYGRVQFRGRMMTANRAMCTLVHGDPPSPRHEAAHSCGKGDEGCVNPRHLSWKTPKENQADRLLHGTLLRGRQLPGTKLDEASVAEIKRDLPTEHRQILADRFGVSRSTIDQIATGKVWGYVEPAARAFMEKLKVMRG